MNNYVASYFQVTDAIDLLTAMRTEDGPRLAKFHETVTAEDGKFCGVELEVCGRRNRPDQKAEFNAVRWEFLESLLNNLQTRFKKIDLLEAMQVDVCFIAILACHTD